MFEIKENTLFVSDIANYLGYEYIGNDIQVNVFCRIDSLVENGFSYFEDYNKSPNEQFGCLILCQKDYEILNDEISYIKCENPKLSFYNIVNEFFIENKKHKISLNAIIDSTSKIGVNVSISDNSYIGKNVSIGDNTIIEGNVIIKGDVSIGRNCYIKDGAVIGSEGFDFIEDGDRLTHIPQIGKIEIQNNVWIGSNSVVERSTLGKTILENGVKIDDLVQIGNSCLIKKNTRLAAGVVLGSESKVGKNTFIGMNVSIKENIIIGNKVIVGSGASVVCNLDDETTYIGVPAKKMLKRER